VTQNRDFGEIDFVESLPFCNYISR